MVFAPLIGPIATGTGRAGVAALLRRFRKNIPAGLGASLKFIVNHAEELEEAGLCPWCGTDHPLGAAMQTHSRRSRTRAQRSIRPKPKRKVSAYQREFGRQLKKLKRAHPRTPVTKLMKRAHAATKRIRRGK